MTRKKIIAENNLVSFILLFQVCITVCSKLIPGFIQKNSKMKWKERLASVFVAIILTYMHQVK
jgi:hypothetical protein